MCIFHTYFINFSWRTNCTEPLVDVTDSRMSSFFCRKPNKYPSEYNFNYLLKFTKLNACYRDVRMNVLLEPYISPRDKAAVIQNITFTELKEYTDKLLGKMYLQVSIVWQYKYYIINKKNIIYLILLSKLLPIFEIWRRENESNWHPRVEIEPPTTSQKPLRP